MVPTVCAGCTWSFDQAQAKWSRIWGRLCSTSLDSGRINESGRSELRQGPESNERPPRTETPTTKPLYVLSAAPRQRGTLAALVTKSLTGGLQPQRFRRMITRPIPGSSFRRERSGPSSSRTTLPRAGVRVHLLLRKLRTGASASTCFQDLVRFTPTSVDFGGWAVYPLVQA